MSSSAILLFLTAYACNGQVDGIYCGKKTCFDVLNVSRGADKIQINQAYRSLAKLYHPDRHKSPNAKAEAEQKFRLIATAYEILRDPEQRQEYEYMLDNPTEMYYHYYRYYRRRYSPKVDVRLICLVMILVLSAIQYISQKTKYCQAISYLVRDPKYRSQAKEFAIAQKRFYINRQKYGRRLTREEMKIHEEEVIRDVIIENFDVRGDCGPPSIRKTLVVQIILLPYRILHVCCWALRWFVLFILRRPYGPEEREYLTRWRLGYSHARWEGLDEEKRANFVRMGLWDVAKFNAYSEHAAEEIRKRAAEDTSQKRYRRYIKRFGQPAVNFDES